MFLTAAVALLLSAAPAQAATFRVVSTTDVDGGCGDALSEHPLGDHGAPDRRSTRFAFPPASTGCSSASSSSTRR